MTSIGETLRRERVRRGLDLQQVSRDTKISVKLLEHIEAEEFDKLPGGVFTKSFVRQYARALGLDEDEIVGELQRMTQPLEAAPETEEQPPAAPDIRLPRVSEWPGHGLRSGSSLPAFALVVVVMLVCSGIYAWWQRSRRPQPAPEPVVAERQQAPAASAPGAAPPQAQSAPEPAAADRQAEAPPVSAPVQPTSGQPAPIQPAVQTGAPGTVGSGAFHVAVTAAEETWISAKLDGKQAFSGTLQANQTKLLEANGQVRLLIGNAGGLEISMNGKPIGSVGPRGQVRIVELTPAGYQIVPRKPVESDPL